MKTEVKDAKEHALTTQQAESDAPDSAVPKMQREFQVPQRRIITKEDLDHFLESATFERIFDYVCTCSDAVRGMKISDPVEVRAPVQKLLDLLEAVDRIVDETPAVEEAQSRFGNPAFRMLYDKLEKAIPDLLMELVNPKEAIPEVGKYLQQSFGDRKRIDYGTGHEANFMAFLLALDTLGVFQSGDKAALILRGFNRYIKLMRKIQFTYWLEPAGSHGVWGLDDYHSLPFLFGASQLATHKHLRPKSIHQEEIVNQFAPDYMYLACIKFINAVKSAPSLRWHSPMLDDISGAKSWAKIESGMCKMYRAEVMSKLPIMQHYLFGSLISFTNVSGRVVRDEDLQADDGHLHTYAMGQQFPTCCGMRLPSAIAAREREGRQRALPFD